MKRSRWLVIAALAWSAWRAGLGDDVINGRGWSSFRAFWKAALNPELSGEFLTLTLDAAATTLALAVLGTAASLIVGWGGALATSELVMADRVQLRRVAAAVLAVPRAIHEIIWALLLVQIFGFDPLVGVLAIAIPFGAVTAKVFAETIDEAPRDAYQSLRAAGAGRLAALSYGVLPTVGPELVAYAFYRLECAVRSAAVLGVVGIGGLGFQLDLSFQTLRYAEIWTLIGALVVLSGGVDWWSSRARRGRVRVGTTAVMTAAIGIAISAWWVGLTPSVLVGDGVIARAGAVMTDLATPRLGLGGWTELGAAVLDTVALSLLALATAAVGGLVTAVASRRRSEILARPSVVGRLIAWAARFVLLFARANPAPIWAFLMVLVLFPGVWPGAVALGIYNLGVMGRLFADALDDRDPAPTDQLLAAGAGSTAAVLYGVLPTAAPRLVALALYRWEVIVRETVIVGVVGAGGLGQLLNEHLVARDLSAVSGVIIAIVALAVVGDWVSARMRSQLR